MNRQVSSSSSRAPARPSLSHRRISRRLSTLSGLEDGDTEPTHNVSDNSVIEELAQLKKYEDFTTIDWVQDAAREQTRRRTRRKDAFSFFQQDGVWRWRKRIWESYDAAQAWVVITLVAVIIGINAAALNIITEYLSDLKLGYCSNAWYLNENFCCYGAENGCDEWRRWTSFSLVNYVIYTLMAVLFAATASYLVKIYAPYAAGSGISEIKCIIGGFVMKGFLGFWTLLIKSVCLPLAIASGLSVGKEGPSVHYATCVGNVVSRFFDKYKQSASKTREILTASSGTGVAVAFGSPIGGVLFSLEEMSSHFPLKTLWRSYFCALIATAVLAAMNPFRTGQLVMFSVKYDRDWHFFEILFYIVLGVFGGVYGAIMIRGHLMVQAFRKKYLTNYAIAEAMILAGVTALLCYPNMFTRVDMTEMMEMLFRECEGDYDYHGLCEPENRLSNIMSLLIATLLRSCLVALSYGAKVPAGIFVPSMAIGASFGRMLGIMVEWLHASHPHSRFFSSCDPDVPCITPGTYAFLGAGAALSGIMHLTISVTVIMFELTGALTYILPSMIVIGVTKAVGDQLSKAGIADVMIQFNGYPFLDNKEEHNFGVPSSQAMTRNLTMLPTTGLRVKAAQKLVDDTTFSGFPVVDNMETRILLGYIDRADLQYALEKARLQGLLAADAKCSFSRLVADTNESPESAHPQTTFDGIMRQLIDLSAYVDHAPILVHPALPLETTMELFKKMGPRVILVEHHGRLQGLITIKDCLRYQVRVEALEHSSHHVTINPNGIVQQRQERVWFVMQGIGQWAASKLNELSRGRLRLSPRNMPVERTGWSRLPEHAADPSQEYEYGDEMLDGFDDHSPVSADHNVEMDIR